MTLIELMRITDELYRYAYGKIEFDLDGLSFKKNIFLMSGPEIWLRMKTEPVI